MAGQYVVEAPVTVIRKEGHERYLERGTIFDAEKIDDDNAEHLLAAGLIADYEAPEPVEEETPAGSFTQADIDAAVKAAVDAKDAELADARKAVEEEAQKLAAERAEFEKAQKPTPAKAPAK